MMPEQVENAWMQAAALPPMHCLNSVIATQAVMGKISCSKGLILHGTPRYATPAPMTDRPSQEMTKSVLRTRTSLQLVPCTSLMSWLQCDAARCPVTSEHRPEGRT